MKLIDILFKTRSDAKGADQTKAAIKGTADEAQKSQGAFGRMRAGIENLSHSGGAFGRIFGGALRALTSPLGLVAAGIGLVTSALVAATKALKAFAKQELSETDLDSALAQMGQLTDAYRTKLQKLSSELQTMTTIGDEAWLKSFSQLTRFGMSSANVDQVSEAVKNLTGLLGGDEGSLNAATMLIQRALEGQFDMFTRYGIVVQRTGDRTKDLNNLFTLLAEKGGGILEARANTLTGRTKSLKNAWGDFNEAIGGVISRTGVVQGVLGGITDSLKGMEEAVKTNSTVMEGLVNKVETLADFSWNNLADQIKPITEAKFDVTQRGVQTLGDQLSAAAKESQRLRENMEAMESAELGREIAGISLQEARGDITPEEAAWQKEQARYRVRTRQFLRERADKEAAIVAAQEIIANTQTEMGALYDKARNAENARLIEDEKLKAAGVQPAELPSAVAKATEDVERARAAAARPEKTSVKDLQGMGLKEIYARWKDQMKNADPEAFFGGPEVQQALEDQVAAAEKRLKLLKDAEDLTAYANREIQKANDVIPSLQDEHKKAKEALESMTSELARLDIGRETIGIEHNIAQAQFKSATASRAEKEAKQAEAERARADREALKQKKLDDAAAAEAALTPEQRQARLQGSVQPLASQGGVTYGGDVGRATQKKAQEIIKRTSEVEVQKDQIDDLAAEAVNALQQLGTIQSGQMANLSRVYQEIVQLKEQQLLLQSQLKHER